MRRFFFYRGVVTPFSFLFFSMILFLSACENSDDVRGDLVALQKELSIIKSQRTDLDKQIIAIESQIQSLQPENKNYPKVMVTRPRKGVFEHFITLQGNAKADKHISMHPEVGGTIREILVKEGQWVTKGHIMLKLDADVIDNNISEVRTSYDFAKVLFEKRKRLWNLKIGSEISYLEAKNKKEGLEKKIASLEAQRSKLHIKAPFGAYVDQIFAKEGGLASQMTPVLDMINYKKMYIEVDVSESYVSEMKKGTEARLFFGSLSSLDTIFSKVSWVSKSIDEKSRTFKLHINIENPQGEIKTNMVARVVLKNFESQGVIIPEELIREDLDGNSFVFVVSRDESIPFVTKQIITVKSNYKGGVLISEGLTGEELLVSKGMSDLENGDKVELVAF